MVACCPKGWIKFFKAMADEHRQMIMALISKHQSINASGILKHLKITQSTLSHHLAKLEEANLIESQKKGKEVFYKVNNKTVKDCCFGLADKLILEK